VAAAGAGRWPNWPFAAWTVDEQWDETITCRARRTSAMCGASGERWHPASRV
jgi:hypothetical protein